MDKLLAAEYRRVMAQLRKEDTGCSVIRMVGALALLPALACFLLKPVGVVATAAATDPEARVAQATV